MAAWKPLDQMNILSKHYPRIDGTLKVSGKAKYTYDLKPEGLHYGMILHSPHPAAKIVRIDASKVEQHPGVKAVLTDIHPTGTCRFVGDTVAAFAATSPEIARDVVDLFDVEYEILSFAADLDAAMREGAPRVFADKENVGEARVRGEGEIENAFGPDDIVVEATYRTQVQTHSCLEVHGSLAMWKGDELYLWDSTQAVHGVRESVARFLELPMDKVHVICHHMGAGFGSKLQAGNYSGIAAKLAQKAGAPVKLMLTREQDFLAAGNRPDSIQKIKAAANKEGNLTAFHVITHATAGIGSRAGVRIPIVYDDRIPNWRHEHYDVFTNAGAARAFRAPGCPQGAFAMEQIMDELAEKVGMDPLEFRLKNDSNQTRQKEWRIGAERIGWQRRRNQPGSDPGPIKRGLGLGASIWWPGGRDTQAQMTIYPDGAVEVRCGTQDIGTGSRTLVAAIAAEELGLQVKDITALVGESDFPKSGASGGSTTSPSVAPAIKNTAEKATAQLAEIAAKHFEVMPADVHIADGKAMSNGKSLSWKELCSLLGTDPMTVHGEWVEGLSSAGVAGCQFAEVAVDTETGRITVEKVVAVADCGLVLNRLTTESQVNGAVIQGISYALLENRLMDPITGNQINTEFENYKILGALETPEIEVVLFDEAERGVIGIGEPPKVPTAGAIANAVYNAIGVRIREIPMTPDRVLMALMQA